LKGFDFEMEGACLGSLRADFVPLSIVV